MPRQYNSRPVGRLLSFQATIIQLRNFLAMAHHQPASAEDLNVVWGAGPQPWLQASLTDKYYARKAARVRAAAAAAPGSDVATIDASI